MSRLIKKIKNWIIKDNNLSTDDVKDLNYNSTLPSSNNILPKTAIFNSNIYSTVPSSVGYNVGAMQAAQFTNSYFANYSMLSIPPNIMSFSDNGKEIVRLNNDGTVIWADNIRINEAAEAFSKSLTIGAEIRAGLTDIVKRRMRDTIFEELINIADEKGSLDANDLTYLLQSAKIMDKLKGA